MSLCCGCRAAYGASTVVGPHDVGVFHIWQKREIVVMGLCAHIDDLIVSANFIPRDDAVRTLRWSPGDLH